MAGRYLGEVGRVPTRDADAMAEILETTCGLDPSHSKVFDGVENIGDVKQKVYDYFERHGGAATSATKDWQRKKNQAVRDKDGNILDGEKLRRAETDKVSMQEKLGILFKNFMGKKEKDPRLWGSSTLREASRHAQGGESLDDSDFYTPYGNEFVPPPLMMESQGDARSYVVQYVEAPFDPLNEDDALVLHQNTTMRTKSLSDAPSLRPSPISRSGSSGVSGLVKSSTLWSDGRTGSGGSLGRTSSLARSSSGSSMRQGSGEESDYFSEGEEATMGMLGKVTSALGIQAGMTAQDTPKYTRTGTGNLMRASNGVRRERRKLGQASLILRQSSLRKGGDGSEWPRDPSQSPSRPWAGKEGSNDEDQSDLYALWGMEGLRTPSNNDDDSSAAAGGRSSSSSLSRTGSGQSCSPGHALTTSGQMQLSRGSFTSPVVDGGKQLFFGQSRPSMVTNHLASSIVDDDDGPAPVAPIRRSRSSQVHH